MYRQPRGGSCGSCLFLRHLNPPSSNRHRRLEAYVQARSLRMHHLFLVPLLSLLTSTTLAASIQGEHEPPRLAPRNRGGDNPGITIGASVACGVIAIAFAIWCCRQKPWVTPDKPQVERSPTMPPSYGMCLEEARPPEYAASSTSGRPSGPGPDGRASPPPYVAPAGGERGGGAAGAGAGAGAASGGAPQAGMAPGNTASADGVAGGTERRTGTATAQAAVA
ncbi:hypothetical protein B0T14DRAFT_324786 [Immersiella caudata]|uniref:Uncharacterized protein n=1 Tax=Immersiella caudata TaxID=314043 RepID=A0AA39TL28_9PEZI|nr:hypothetical protein B0T14DRAFT_324786 [Immersiella caudata]